MEKVQQVAAVFYDLSSKSAENEIFSYSKMGHEGANALRKLNMFAEINSIRLRDVADIIFIKLRAADS